MRGINKLAFHKLAFPLLKSNVSSSTAMSKRNTIVDLKAMCNAKGLATSGSKSTPKLAPKGKKRSHERKKASSSAAADSEPEELVVRSSTKAGVSDLLECLRPDKLTPVMEGGVTNLLKRLAPLPQLAFNSGENVPFSQLLASSEVSSENVRPTKLERKCVVSCFVGCVFLEGYGPLMLSKMGTHYMCSVSTMILSVRKDDTPGGCAKLLGKRSVGGAGGTQTKNKKSFSTPPKSISVFTLSNSDITSVIEYTPPRKKLVDAIRESTSVFPDISSLPDEIVLSAIAAAAICASEGATVGEAGHMIGAAAPGECAITRIFDAVKSTPSAEPRSRLLVRSSQAVRKAHAEQDAPASHPFDAVRGGTPMHHKAQKKIYNKAMKSWLALSNREVESQLRRMRTANAAEDQAAAVVGSVGGGAAASSSSTPSSSSSSSSSSATAGAGVKRQKITSHEKEESDDDGEVEESDDDEEE